MWVVRLAWFGSYGGTIGFGIGADVVEVEGSRVGGEEEGLWRERVDEGCGIGCGAGVQLADVNVDIQAQLEEVLLVQRDGDLAYDVSCLRCCCFHKSICSSGEEQLAIMAEAETPATAFVSTRSPCCLNCAVAGL